MPTQHSIFNLAAGMLGEPPLQNMDEETEPGRVLRTFWAGTVLYCIEAYAWNFLEKRAELSRLSATPEWGYAYYYQQPADCERILTISQTGDEQDDFTAWRDEAGKIATDAETVYLRYVSSERKSTPGAWSETFANWVAAELAIRAAPKINAKALDAVSKAAKKYRSEAKSNDAANNPTRRLRPGSWSRAARGWSRNYEQGR